MFRILRRRFARALPVPPAVSASENEIRVGSGSACCRRKTPAFRGLCRGNLHVTPQRWFVVIAVLCVVLAGGGAAAQVLTGSISGTVRDDSGGVLLGATVRVRSPSLIGGWWWL